jgi:CMP-N,N'-diacetyllegionaminic acid synthase
MNIAIIPARGGSKGIPKKNIVDLAGRPLIAWSIEQAKSSQLVDIVFVSTDDDEIAEISQKYGAEIIKRPAQFATDSSSSEDALLHAIGFIEREKKNTINIVIFLQATSPVREKDDIDNAVRKYSSENADSLFSCMRIEDYFIWQDEDGGYCSVSYDYHNRKLRQSIKPRYLENGSIYVFSPELIRNERNRLGGKITIYEMPFWKSFQVDDRDDLEICEYYIKTRLLKQKSKYEEQTKRDI